MRDAGLGMIRDWDWDWGLGLGIRDPGLAIRDKGFTLFRWVLPA
jgi:hypothetical protein